MATQPLDYKFFNIDIITVRDEDVKNLGEITRPNIFESNTTKFDPEGLFSTDIFGPLGSDIRKTSLGYIDLKLDTMHPHVFTLLMSLNSKYEEILEGKVRAKYDIEKGDLVEDKINGKSGYSYFMSVLPRIKFNDNGSEERKHKIELVKRYANQKHMSNKLLVLPAGLRDYRVDSSGKPMESEVNSLYRKVLAITSLIKTIKVNEKNAELLDPIRFKLQKAVCEIYEYFYGLINGKKKFIQDKWVKRAIVNGTRNVLTPVPYKLTNLNNNKITTNHTVCGLYQFIKAISPITMNRVKTMFINKFISQNSNTAKLVDAGTMKTTLVNININKRDEWLSMEGMVKIMNKMKQPDLRFEPVIIDNNYLQLVYDNGRDIVVLDDTKEITKDMEPEFIRPITYIEMFYISIYDVKDKYPGFVTRYPVANLGGIYPCYVYVKTTFKSRVVNMTINGNKMVMEEYPILGEECMESVSASAQHIKALGGDYDGDSCLGHVYCRFRKKNYPNIVYEYGLINLEDFPKWDLIKTEGNKEYYEVPEYIEVLTVWNGKKKWVKPESYSIHKNLTMLSVKTKRGRTIECSNDHSLVTVDEKLNYKRFKAMKYMTIPRLKNSLDSYIDPTNFKRKVRYLDTTFNLNKDLGYLIGAMIGDGWINSDEYDKYNCNSVMLATTHKPIANKITKIMSTYGYNHKHYSVDKENKFDNSDNDSVKYTWTYAPVAKLLRKNIGANTFNRKLPNWWLNTSKNFRWGLLSGLMDTDGCIGKYKDGMSFTYTTVSRQLAYDIVALCDSLEISAGISYHKKRTKDTFEYTINISPLSIDQLKKHLILFNPYKKERLDQVVYIGNKDAYISTPNVSLDRLRELLSHISYSNDKINHNRVAEAIKIAKKSECGGYLNKHQAIEILNKYWFKLKKSQYWRKFKSMVEDDSIEWDVITSIEIMKGVTEAYDLTTPPYCTFVIHNGIIVYDTVSLNIVYTDESIKEINNLLNSKKYYLTPEGSMAYSADDDVIDLVLAHMTDEPNKHNISTEDNLAKEHPKDSAVMAKFDDKSLIKILSILRYTGIKSNIKIEDLHITIYHSKDGIKYVPPGDNINYRVEINNITNIDNGIAISVNSSDIINRRALLTENNNIPKLHFDIVYDKTLTSSELQEANAKLKIYLDNYGRELYLDKELLIEKDI